MSAWVELATAARALRTGTADPDRAREQLADLLEHAAKLAGTCESIWAVTEQDVAELGEWKFRAELAVVRAMTGQRP